MTEVYYTTLELGCKIFVLSFIIGSFMAFIGLIIGTILDEDSVDKSKHPILCKTSDMMLKYGTWNAMICMLVIMIGFFIHVIMTIAMSLFA